MKASELIEATNKELVRLQKDIKNEISYRTFNLAKEYILANTSIIEIGNFRTINSTEYIIEGTDALKQEHEVTLYILFEKNRCSIDKHVILSTIPTECTYRSVFIEDNEE